MQIDNRNSISQITFNELGNDVNKNITNKETRNNQDMTINENTLGKRDNPEKTGDQKLLEAIEKASGKVEVENKGLEFAIHEKTNQIVIRIINEDTHEIIKELPSEKILDMVAKMIELSGMYINEKR